MENNKPESAKQNRVGRRITIGECSGGTSPVCGDSTSMGMLCPVCIASYTDTTITLVNGDVLQIGASTWLTAVVNPDGTITHTHVSADGTEYEIVIPYFQVNPDGSFTYVYTDGTTAIIPAQVVSTLVVNPDGSVTYTDETGLITTLPAPAGGSILTEVINPDGSKTYTHDDGTGNTQTFCTGVVLEDHHGNTTTLDCVSKELHRTTLLGDLHTNSVGSPLFMNAHADSDDTAVNNVHTRHRRMVSSSTGATATGDRSHVTASDRSSARGNGTFVAGSRLSSAGSGSGAWHAVVGGSGCSNNGTFSVIGGDLNRIDNASNVVYGTNNRGTGARRSMVVGLGNTFTEYGNSISGESNTATQRQNILGGFANTASGQRNITSGDSNRSSGLNGITSGEGNLNSGRDNIISGRGVSFTGGIASIAVVDNIVTANLAGTGSAYFGRNVSVNPGGGTHCSTHGSDIVIDSNNTHVFSSPLVTTVASQGSSVIIDGLNLGINTTTPTASLDINGTAIINTLWATSDENKKNTKELAIKGDFTADVTKSYQWKKEFDPESGKTHEGWTHHGFSAQALLDAGFTEAVREKVIPAQEIYETVTEEVEEKYWDFDVATPLKKGEKSEYGTPYNMFLFGGDIEITKEEYEEGNASDDATFFGTYNGKGGYTKKELLPPVEKTVVTSYEVQKPTGKFTKAVPTGEYVIEPTALIATLWKKVQALESSK